MRMPWSKPRGEQLDLLYVEERGPTEPAAVGGSAAEIVLEPGMQTSLGVALAATADDVHGQTLLVPIGNLDEDPANPRTEFRDEQIQELAEDIQRRGMLQPIVVHPADASNRHQLHFGAMRLRAARRAGLESVPVVVRAVAADPYAQAAENQKRFPLEPMELARLIQRRAAAGDSNATIARQLGMDLTTVAHHLALLELPAPLEHAYRSGRCTSPRTLYELRQLHAERPDEVDALLNSETPITRSGVDLLRRGSVPIRASRTGRHPRPTTLMDQAMVTCSRLEGLVSRLQDSPVEMEQADVAALRSRLAGLVDRLR